MAKKRNEIDNIYKWDLSSIFKNRNEFELEYNSVSKDINEINKIKDDIFLNSDNLLNYFKLEEKLERRIYKLYFYAHLNFDSDTLNTEYQEDKEKIENLITIFSSLISFFDPSILKQDYNKIMDFCNENKELSIYKFRLEEIFRFKNHILDEKEENIISKFSKILSVPENIYDTFTDSDLKFGEICDSKGNHYELNDSNYSIYIRSDDRTTRKNAFDLMFSTYKNYENTISNTFRSNVEALELISKLRNYNSTIEASLYADNISLDIYNNLIKTVSDNLDVLYKYYDMKKDILKLDSIHLYDVYAPLIKNSNKTYSFDEAKELVKSSLEVLGKDYIKIIDKAFNEKWIDIYHNEGKRSGAYSSGFYDTNPYVLLNYEGNINDVSTLAHELGHSCHTYLSCKNNPYVYSSYKIFVAEVASTVNELLLSKYLLKVSNDKDEKLTILNNLLELFRTTIYRQTMFAEFERDMHKINSEGTILTKEVLSNSYYELVKKYFGDNVVIDELIKYEWERIPHFYYNFYVYKYAIGLSCACYIVTNILDDKENALENYIKFLSSGGSDYPANELKIAGIDVSSSEVILSAIKMFDSVIEEFKSLIK